MSTQTLFLPGLAFGGQNSYLKSLFFTLIKKSVNKSKRTWIKTTFYSRSFTFCSRPNIKYLKYLNMPYRGRPYQGHRGRSIEAAEAVQLSPSRPVMSRPPRPLNRGPQGRSIEAPKAVQSRPPRPFISFLLIYWQIENPRNTVPSLI